MATLLICLIYLAFVSMGLPDSLLGSAWPSIYEGMNVSISAVGIVTIILFVTIDWRSMTCHTDWQSIAHSSICHILRFSDAAQFKPLIR